MKLYYIYLCLFFMVACAPSSTTVVKHQKDLDGDGKNDVFISTVYDNGIIQSECIKTNYLDTNTITQKIYSQSGKLLCIMNKNVSDHHWAFTFYYEGNIYLKKKQNNIVFFDQDGYPYYEFYIDENNIFILQQQGVITTNAYQIIGFDNDNPFAQNVEEFYLNNNKLIEKNTVVNDNTHIIYNIFSPDDKLVYRASIYLEDNKTFIQNEVCFNKIKMFTETIHPKTYPFIIFWDHNNSVDRNIRLMENGKIKISRTLGWANI